MARSAETQWVNYTQKGLERHQAAQKCLLEYLAAPKTCREQDDSHGKTDSIMFIGSWSLEVLLHWQMEIRTPA